MELRYYKQQCLETVDFFPCSFRLRGSQQHGSGVPVALSGNSSGLKHFSCGPLTCKRQDLQKLRFVISSAVITVAICKEETRFLWISRTIYTLVRVRKFPASLKYENNQHNLNVSVSVVEQSAVCDCQNTFWGRNKSSLSMLREDTDFREKTTN